MKFNVNLFVGLAFCVVVLGLFGVFQRVLEIRESWRSDDLYTAAKHSTYSVATSSTGWHTSNSSGVSAISVRSANSMFRHRPVFSYAPASAPAYSQSPIGGMPSNSVASPIYTTSSAEFRSFGGGGNGGGVSMSGGVATSSGAASAAGLTTTMPSTSMYAYSNDRNPSSVATNDWMSSVSGGIAMASTSSYAGIGQTTGGASRGISERKNSIGMGGLLDNWVQDLIGNGDYWSYNIDGIDYFDYEKLRELYNAAIANGELPAGVSWEQFLSWFGAQSDRYDFPIPSGVWFMCFLAIGYALYIAYRRKQKVVNS